MHCSFHYDRILYTDIYYQYIISILKCKKYTLTNEILES